MEPCSGRGHGEWHRLREDCTAAAGRSAAAVKPPSTQVLLPVRDMLGVSPRLARCCSMCSEVSRAFDVTGDRFNSHSVETDGPSVADATTRL
jgi:hypothetical protein